MNAWTRDGERKLSETKRRRPHQPFILHLAAESGGDLGEAEVTPPDELHLEITHPAGETAAWLDDLWWLDVLHRWQERALSVQILPSPHALLHPVVLHQMAMLRRVAPRWSRVGYAYVDDVVSDDDIARLAVAPYDEVRIIDGFRPGTGKLHGLDLQSLVGRVTRLQAAARALRPVLVRVAPQELPTAIAAAGELQDAVYTST